MPASKAQIMLSYLPSGWRLLGRGRKIKKVFLFKDFFDALQFADHIGVLADQEDHHPDLGVAWGRCEVTLRTHAAGGLTNNDFILAAKIETLTKR
ncbi:MAG: 4a-hydroxytetrahydrobiopterin dehydratase [Elusimicrobia bacterium]|nr:4a-hydroxytetrahydrobiopterin dehydratase [Elusimicrobiota bacterium]